MNVFMSVRHPVARALNDYLEVIFGASAYNRRPAPEPVRTAAKEAVRSIPRLTPYGEFIVKEYRLDERWDELEALAKQYLTLEETQKLDEARAEFEQAIKVYGAFENEDIAASQRLTTLLLGSSHSVSFSPDVKLEHLVTGLISSRDRFLKTSASVDLQTFINDAEIFLDDPKAMEVFFATRRKVDFPEAKLLLAELKSKVA